jgi:oligopeptide transport system ATP-binding protein
MMDGVLLEVRSLTKMFPVTRGFFVRRCVGNIRAVDNVSFEIKRGETLGLVGESGSGKTTLGQCVLQIIRPTSGDVVFDGADLCKLSESELLKMRQRFQPIFQDPYSSLDPRQKVGSIVGEALVINGLARGHVSERVSELLTMVELPPEMAQRYPHMFSGGQRQRIGIARALATGPDFLVCDEPVSALDVSIQAQIVNLLDDLQTKLRLTLLFISHDLSLVRHISDRIAVMYLGRIVELARSADLYVEPLHPYTRALISAVPIPDPSVERKRHRLILRGEIPSPLNPPAGCTFHPRCQERVDVCDREVPPLAKRGERWVACHLHC